ncbi:MAG: hypothetical protein Q8O28_13285 [Smithellaceae bacterium]|nr:hypothetical protein [Smithellaceae bacterium]
MKFLTNKEHLYTTIAIEKLTMIYVSIEQDVKSARNLYDKLVSKKEMILGIFLNGVKKHDN